MGKIHCRQTTRTFPILKSQQRGQQTEFLACQHLKQQGLQFITQNYHCAMGEIDLIMTSKNLLIFIEVRYRKNDSFGSAAASVTRKKQQKIIQTAQLFLLENSEYHNHDCRFDVMAMSPHGQGYRYDWIQGAFE